MNDLPYNPIFANKPSARLGRIYFITAGPFVKIGHSARCPKQRMKTMQCGCPYKMELVAVVDGAVSDERQLHRDFAEYSAYGEWFRCEGALADFISRLNARL